MAYDRCMINPSVTNPLVANIRSEMEWHAEVAANYALERNRPVGKLEILLQTMLVSCSHDPHEVWLGKSELVRDVVENVERGNVAEAGQQMETAMEQGSLRT